MRSGEEASGREEEEEGGRGVGVLEPILEGCLWMALGFWLEGVRLLLFLLLLGERWCGLGFEVRLVKVRAKRSRGPTLTKKKELRVRVHQRREKA
jgi:hypothetical protein